MGLIFDIGFNNETNFEDIPWNLSGLRWRAGSGNIYERVPDDIIGDMEGKIWALRNYNNLVIHEIRNIPENVSEWAGRIDYMLTFDVESLKMYVERVIENKVNKLRSIPMNAENYYELKKVMFPEVIVNFYGNIYIDDEILDVVIDELRTIPEDERPIWNLWEFDEANTTWIIA